MIQPHPSETRLCLLVYCLDKFCNWCRYVRFLVSLRLWIMQVCPAMAAICIVPTSASQPNWHRNPIQMTLVCFRFGRQNIDGSFQIFCMCVRAVCVVERKKREKKTKVFVFRVNTHSNSRLWFIHSHQPNHYTLRILHLERKQNQKKKLTKICVHEFGRDTRMTEMLRLQHNQSRCQREFHLTSGGIQTHVHKN